MSSRLTKILEKAGEMTPVKRSTIHVIEHKTKALSGAIEDMREYLDKLENDYQSLTHAKVLENMSQEELDHIENQLSKLSYPMKDIIATALGKSLFHSYN